MNDFEKTVKKLTEEHEDASEFLLEVADMLSSAGDFERAVKIREALLASQITVSLKEKIMVNLAADFHKAGMYDNALTVLEDALIISHHKDEVLDMLSHISAEMNDWKKVVSYQRLKQNKDHEYLSYALCQWSRELISDSKLKEGLLKLKEAELITPNSMHIKLHYADLFIKEDKVQEIVDLGREVFEKHPGFFSLLAKKVLESGKALNLFVPVIMEYLGRYPSDMYILYNFVKKLVQAKKHKDALQLLKKYYTGKIYSPYVLKQLFELSLVLREPVDTVYLEQFLNVFGDTEKWFRCANCGYESEQFHFVCERCRRLDTAKSIW